MPRALMVLLVLSLSLALAPATALAQYMYLDSNGDGVYSAADVLAAEGTTLATVWIRTDQNRDGSPTSCLQGNYPMDFFSYQFVLHANGGSVNWGGFANDLPDAPVRFIDQGDSTEWSFGRGGVRYNPPGLYKLASFSVGVRSGAPSIEIIAQSRTVGWAQTMLGSPCPAAGYNNSPTLGVDWFDVDGLPYSTGGPQNRGPVLAQPADMTAATGEVAGQALSATDADGNPLAFAKGAGPSFFEVSTVTRGSGTAEGHAVIAPRRGDAGTSGTASVIVSDGATSDERTFSVSAPAGPNHAPFVRTRGEIAVSANAVARVPIYAGDSDGDAVRITLPRGPSFAALSTYSAGTAAATALLTLEPTDCDVGTTAVTIGADDGSGRTQAAIRVTVTPFSEPGGHILHGFFASGSGPSLALGDWNLDGRLDAARAMEGSGGISILFGGGDGSLIQGAVLPDQRGTHGLVAADFDRDGSADLASANWYRGTVALFRGRPDGTFQSAVGLAVHPGATRPIAADLNRDGWLDLVVAHQMAMVVSVFLHDRAGGFLPRIDVEVPSTAYSVAAEDFDRDGALDLVTGGGGVAQVFLLRGFGDGYFAKPQAFPAMKNLMDLVAADFNEDGLPDVLAMPLEPRAWLLLGDGQGGFAPPREVPGAGTLQALQWDLAAGDWNADGHADYFIAADDSDGRIHLGNGDGSFRDEAILPRPGQSSAAFGDLDGDGWLDLVGDRGAALVNGGYPARGPRARAFVIGEERTITAASAARELCVRLEPMGASYRNADVDPASLRLCSTGTGSVESIQAIAGKVTRNVDSDHNGAEELPVCFAGADIAVLFDGLRGREPVTARLEGRLRSGTRMCAPIDLDVIGTARTPVAAILAPNPLNPRATLSFATSRPGRLEVQVFDVQGRLVRRVLALPAAPAEGYAVEIDGRDDAGRPLGSGVYFYRVDSADGVQTGRFVILK